MTRREFYKYLKQHKLFSIFCSYLASCYEAKLVGNPNFVYCYKLPRNKLEEFIKSNVETSTSLENLADYIKRTWNWNLHTKMIYGGKKK